jgi:elongation factor P
MLEYSEIKKGKVIIYQDEPYVILENHVARTQQRKPQNQVKMRNLVNGRGVNTVFHASDKADEADISKRSIKYLYEAKGEFWFCDIKNPSDRFTLDSGLVEDNKKFLKQNMEVEAMIFDFDDEEKIIGIKLPVKMEFVVKEAPPMIKGASATGGNKRVTLENGTQVEVPLFISEGEKVRINTETGEYVERVNS